MPFTFEYQAPAEESFEDTVQRTLIEQPDSDAALRATVVATKKQIDWKNAASAILTGVTSATEFQSNAAFMMGIGVIVVTCLSPLHVNVISDEAAELLTIIETRARHRTVNFKRMQELLGDRQALEAIQVLEKGGFVRQEPNGDWIIQRIRLASFRLLP